MRKVYSQVATFQQVTRKIE